MPTLSYARPPGGADLLEDLEGAWHVAHGWVVRFGMDERSRPTVLLKIDCGTDAQAVDCAARLLPRLDLRSASEPPVVVGVDGRDIVLVTRLAEDARPEVDLEAGFRRLVRLGEFALWEGA